MSSKPILFKQCLWGFWLASFIFIPAALASNLIPEITNDNPQAKAYFWLRKTDGTTEIVMIPTHTKKSLPASTVELQFLYLEGKETKSILPELSTLILRPPGFREDEDDAGEKEPVRANAPQSSEAQTPSTLKEVSFETQKANPGPELPTEVEKSPKKGKIRRFFEENW